jgi:uncharacterized protein YdeI (YjbR/CyaY-like superfamily)
LDAGFDAPEITRFVHAESEFGAPVHDDGSGLVAGQLLRSRKDLTLPVAEETIPGMATIDPRVDNYIAKAPDFAKPILKHLRQLIHEACPAAEETLKWSMPSFMHKGILCGFAAFNNHCTFGFWKGDLMFAGNAEAKRLADQAMGHFGRITSLADLPKDAVLMGYIQEAVRLNEAGIKKPAPPRPKAKKKVVVPEGLLAALKKNKKALTTFENFSPSHKREYVEWITEAKRDETRQQRLRKTIAWLAEGKPRNWKYMNC